MQQIHWRMIEMKRTNFVDITRLAVAHDKREKKIV